MIIAKPPNMVEDIAMELLDDDEVVVVVVIVEVVVVVVAAASWTDCVSGS